MSVRVKICGITDRTDAAQAVAAGADSLGFNFYPGSPRFVTPETAADIIATLPETVGKVGVFVNETPASIAETVRRAGLTAVQLHGDETPAVVAAVRAAAGVPVIKALRVGPGFDVSAVSGYGADAILLDAFAAADRGGTGIVFDWEIARLAAGAEPRIYLAGGLGPDNVAVAVREAAPYAVDACSRLESGKGRKDAAKMRDFVAAAKAAGGGGYRSMEDYQPDESGYWGQFGGRFVPETLMSPLEELTAAYLAVRDDPGFQSEFGELLADFSGRPTPLFFARRLSERLGGARIFLKREDLGHTGSHKINNAIGQVLLARRMGKRRIIAETGAGQHGVATATVCALFGLECVVYMGTEDMRRQELNVFRMRLLGADVRGVGSGSRTLKDAINEALRDWVTNVETTYYLLGSALGPHPYPLMVRDFQSVIGREARRQIIEKTGGLPDLLVACVGGGSNSIGLFHPFLADRNVRMVGVEAGGRGSGLGDHAARFMDGGRVGVLQGTKSYLLQDDDGQIASTHSVSAGLDYASIGPEHAFLRDAGRVEYVSASDAEALAAFRVLAETEGIIPALESSHAVAHVLKAAPEMDPGAVIILNLSGRGDKDVAQVQSMSGPDGVGEATK